MIISLFIVIFIPLGLFIIFSILGFILYFLPSFIDLIRKHKNFIPIFVLNLILGWSIIFWILALIWSFTDDQQEKIITINYKGDRSVY
jgi:cytochrome c biogenesis protein CcdA